MCFLIFTMPSSMADIRSRSENSTMIKTVIDSHADFDHSADTCRCELTAETALMRLLTEPNSDVDIGTGSDADPDSETR